jgi:hypothetical protein
MIVQMRLINSNDNNFYRLCCVFLYKQHSLEHTVDALRLIDR